MLFEITPASLFVFPKNS